MSDVENQEVNLTGVDGIKRKSDGTFEKGSTGNPEGKNGGQAGWQPIAQRYKSISERFSTDEIIAMASDATLAAQKLSYWDCLAVVHMGRAILKSLTVTESGSDQLGKEREALVDRIDGKPKQTNIHEGPDGKSLSPPSFIIDFNGKKDEPTPST